MLLAETKDSLAVGVSDRVDSLRNRLLIRLRPIGGPAVTASYSRMTLLKELYPTAL